MVVGKKIRFEKVESMRIYQKCTKLPNIFGAPMIFYNEVNFCLGGQKLTRQEKKVL